MDAFWQKFLEKCAERNDCPRIEWNAIGEGAKEGISSSYAGRDNFRLRF